MTDIQMHTEQLRVVVDTARCQSYGLCVAINPDVFDIAEGATVAHVLRDVTDDDDRREVEEAIYACPAQAISLQVRER